MNPVLESQRRPHSQTGSELLFHQTKPRLLQVSEESLVFPSIYLSLTTPGSISTQAPALPRRAQAALHCQVSTWKALYLECSSHAGCQENILENQACSSGEALPGCPASTGQAHLGSSVPALHPALHYTCPGNDQFCPPPGVGHPQDRQRDGSVMPALRTMQVYSRYSIYV